MTYPQITPEKRAQIVEALKAGKTKEQVRHELKTGWTTVKRIAIQEGIDPPESNSERMKQTVRERLEQERESLTDVDEAPLEGETWIEIRVVVDDEERLMVRTKPLTTDAALVLIQKVIQSGLTR